MTVNHKQSNTYGTTVQIIKGLILNSMRNTPVLPRHRHVLTVERGVPVNPSQLGGKRPTEPHLHIIVISDVIIYRSQA